MISLALFANMLNIIPNELTLRDQSISTYIGIILCLCFSLIVYAKLSKSDIFKVLFIANIKTNGLSTFLRDAYNLTKRASILLFVNYVISFALILYVALSKFPIELHHLILLSASLPMLFLAGSLAGMLTIGTLTGERHVFIEPLNMKLIGAQLLGVFYFIVSTIWVLSPANNEIFIHLVFWSFTVETIIRLTKSVFTVFAHRVSWYYIILYLCTLEILPLFVIYYFLLRDFSY